MLLPHEAAELQRRQTRWPLHWCMVVLGSLAAGLALSFGIDIVVHGKIDHLLGRTDSVTATVDSVARDGECRSSRTADRPRHRVLASWELDGQPGNGRYHICENRDGDNIPAEGQTVPLWVEDDGTVRDESPTTSRVYNTIMAGISVGITVFVCAPMLVSARRRRQRLLHKGHRPLSAPVPAQVTMFDNYLRVGPAKPRTCGLLGVSIRHRRRGSLSTLNSYALRGQWWLHLAPDDGHKRRIGLLVREHERCWIEFAAKRLR